MSKSTRLFLVGPMGAGKTTVGRRLAKSLHRKFLDADHELERRTGVKIPVIFEIEGEAGFRAREKRLIAELTELDDVVLATGGGAILDPDSRQALAGRGFVVYLHAPIAKLLARTRSDTNRPLLRTADPEARMRELIAQREPLYREVADLIIDTGALTLGDIVKTILNEAAA
jgi:shikimate kinase